MHRTQPSSSQRNTSNGEVVAAALWERLERSIDERSERLVQFRRRLHALPEPANEEVATTSLVAETLREAGLEPRVMRGDTGVIVDLDLGGAGESFIAMRAELDCVRVDDEKNVPYASTRPGLCHACGHDAHCTMALATALVLIEHRELLRELGLRHNVRVIFQPAEETATGARSMIEQGALDNVEAIIAAHVDPFLDAGVIALRKGPLTAACRSFRITIWGESGHSARPHEAIDPVAAAVNVVSLFYQLGPRSIDSRHPLSLTVASIQAGASFNAIPEKAVITGTLRTARAQDMQAVQERMEAVLRGICESTGCTTEMLFEHDAPATNNHPKITDFMADAARVVTQQAADGVVWIDLPSMGGEDFAFYQELVPGALVRLGAATGDNRHPLHSSHFDIDERVLPLGVKLLVRSAVTLAAELALPRA